jgi:hypothetical protein
LRFSLDVLLLDGRWKAAAASRKLIRIMAQISAISEYFLFFRSGFPGFLLPSSRQSEKQGRREEGRKSKEGRGGGGKEGGGAKCGKEGGHAIGVFKARRQQDQGEIKAVRHSNAAVTVCLFSWH